MGILDISSVTTRFVVAEMEYVGLIEKVVDFEGKRSMHISAAELRTVHEAKKRRDALEKEMLAVLETHGQHSSGAGARP